MKIFIHATNISKGGGKSLLFALLEACANDRKVVALLDSRMSVPISFSENQEVRFFLPTIWQRLKAEWWLACNVQSQDIVLCFGSLPPIFKLHGHVTVFVQNRYLVDSVPLHHFPIKTRLRLAIERVWLSERALNADEFVVQTPSMKTVLQTSRFMAKQPVHVRPFSNLQSCYQRKTNRLTDSHEHKQYDFLYAASGEPHKNHRQLVAAWCLLAEQNLFPSLCLTLDENVSEELCAWIDVKKNSYGLKLKNVGFLPHDQVLELYSQARALIYPSRFEAFGLPLIEAIQAGLPVLSAELDYVRDVLDPEQTFDPDSPVSIARAVKRYLGVEEPSLQLSDAENFLHLLLHEPR